MATYDPSKDYTWTPDTKFVLDGREFGLVLNVVRNILKTPEAMNVIMAYEAGLKIDNIMSSAVAEGKITEIKQEDTMKMPVEEINVKESEVVNPLVVKKPTKKRQNG